MYVKYSIVLFIGFLIATEHVSLAARSQHKKLATPKLNASQHAISKKLTPAHQNRITKKINLILQKLNLSSETHEDSVEAVIVLSMYRLLSYSIKELQIFKTDPSGYAIRRSSRKIENSVTQPLRILSNTLFKHCIRDFRGMSHALDMMFDPMTIQEGLEIVRVTEDDLCDLFKDTVQRMQDCSESEMPYAIEVTLFASTEAYRLLHSYILDKAPHLLNPNEKSKSTLSKQEQIDLIAFYKDCFIIGQQEQTNQIENTEA